MADNKNEIIAGLSKLLAETYTVYLKTQNFHWNVKGPQFHSLHAMFMEQYTEESLAIDEIAERIRTLGAPAPGTFLEYQALSSISQTPGVKAASEMVKELFQDQHSLVNTLKSILRVAEELKDDATTDLLVRRVQIHQKNAWMLESTLDG